MNSPMRPITRLGWGRLRTLHRAESLLGLKTIKFRHNCMLERLAWGQTTLWDRYVFVEQFEAAISMRSLTARYVERI